MDYKKLEENARALVVPGKGILAADESIGTIGKRFDSISLENTHENRFMYRNLLFTSNGIEKFISGVITFDETFYDEKDGNRLIEPLLEKGIQVGIKVDMGVKIINSFGETVTQGLDNLDQRTADYAAKGATFAKWRGVLKIDTINNLPSEFAIEQNAQALARYAKICQENGLVPIVEPEVLMDGDHTIEHAMEVTSRVLAVTYKALSDHGVYLPGTLLKPNMVRAGVESGVKFDANLIAKNTVMALQNAMPVSVPGVVFLSGGMSEAEATESLDAMNKLIAKKPWSLSFSYGRALQASCIKAFAGKVDNVQKAQEVLLERAHLNSLATKGEYESALETDKEALKSLYQKNYSY